ncbi:hypothetical protein GTP56_27975 [Duganella sp. FT134W]|uniref:Uncharacterized protein n=1 Tax=Duganella margarita TaxID=2692170 RepID=A0A7X4H820_9BURK|nr:hypothetical protein [Duganella margarita]MYM76007.1 hypothetical protein [Duganella margarita]
MNEALLHVLACERLLDREPVAVALAYCARQRILPPRVPQDIIDDAEHHRATLAAKLCDYGWWIKQLKLRNARERRRQYPCAAVPGGCRCYRVSHDQTRST